MWLRRLVGIVMIITLVGMNVIAIMGLFVADKKQTVGLSTANGGSSQTLDQIPTVSLTADPGTVAVGNAAALSWTTTGSPSSCTASGAWTGAKTPFGAESSERFATIGNFTYTISCTNAAGTAEASTTIAVSKTAGASGKSSSSSSSSSGSGSSSGGSSAGKNYCSGRVPCYSTKEVASHNSKGNCWGWLGDRVINVSGFDAGFHIARSGVASVEVSGICGTDLMPAVSGKVPSADYPRGHEHTLGATSTSDKNYLSYFVGYYDAAKP